VEKVKEKRNKRLYNYLVNTLGISTQMVTEYISDRLDSILSKKLDSMLDGRNFETRVINSVRRKLQEKPLHTFSYTDEAEFDTFLSKTVTRIVREELDTKYQLQVSLKYTGATMVKPAPLNEEELEALEIINAEDAL